MDTKFAAELFTIAEELESCEDHAGALAAMLALVSEAFEGNTYEHDAIRAGHYLAEEVKKSVATLVDALYETIPRLQYVDSGEVANEVQPTTARHADAELGALQVDRAGFRRVQEKPFYIYFSLAA